MIKLNTKITLLVCSVVAAILLLNQYPVSMSLKQTVLDAGESALRDITFQLALSPALREGLARGDATKIGELAKQAEHLTNCSALAIVDENFAVRYNSPTNGIEPPILESFRAVLPQGSEPEVLTKNSKIPVTYAFSAIYSEGGERLGGIVTKLQHEQNQAGLQKAQRDLNAMTMLVMLIAMIFVWELTDKIKGTMFNLEPVEIAQLLVERNALIDAVRDGIFSVDPAGKILHANQAAFSLLAHSLGGFQPAQSGFGALFSHLSLGDILGGDQPIYDNECRIGQDSYYVDFIPIKIKKPEHESLLVTLRLKQEVVRFAEDITGVKSYVEALRAQMHEFNNKLQVVSGLVRGKNYPELEEYIHTLIHLRNREMQQISSRIKDAVLSAFLVSKFDRAAEQKVDFILTDTSRLTSRLPQNLVQDLVVVVGNLLENAFDAVQGCAMRLVTLELVEDAGEICVAVWDSGAEIPEELRECLFDYGVTGKANGNGIGLYLVRQACARNNGYVAVQSSAQDGTEFTAHIAFCKERGEKNVSSTDC